jgi:Kdo2-lipid IVA lauroyltransferase/acyltransferase
MLKLNPLHLILKIFAKLPLPIMHGLGVFLGWIIYVCSKRSAARLRHNLRQSKFYQTEQDLKLAIRCNIGETGKSLLETFAIWLNPQKVVLGFVKNVSGWQHVESALQAGKGIIFLTPHLGCFEITSLYYGAHYPMAVLFREPRQRWLLPLINSGRQRGNVTLAPANATGVKQLLQALKRGEAIGMLPDQAPFEGEGEWASFFGKPAYTMTLASKLAQKTGAQVLMAFGERLPHGGGYHIHITPIATGGIATPALLNAAIERAIAQKPEQYLWGYDRYKIREQEPPPDYYG